MNNDNDDTESVFGQLEETRLQLEEELGFDDFIKAYKTVQVSIDVLKEYDIRARVAQWVENMACDL